MGKNIKRTLIFFFLFTASLITSCSKKKKENFIDVPIDIGTMWVNTTIDPHRAIGLPDLLWERLVFEPLFAYDEFSSPEPLLIKNFTKKDNGKILILELKKNIKFSNGKTLTAEDVLNSFKRFLRLYPFRPAILNIEGAEKFRKGKSNEISGIKVINKGSLMVNLSQAIPDSANIFSSMETSILIAGCGGKCLYGTGPYMIKDVKKLSSETLIILERNPYYTRIKPFISNIRVHLYNSQNEFSKMIEKCKLSTFVEYIPYNLRVPPCYRITKSPLIGGMYMVINPWLYPTSDRKLRNFLRYISWKGGFLKKTGINFGTAPRLIMPYGINFFSYIRSGGFEENIYRERGIRLTTRNLKEATRTLFLEFLERRLSALGIKLKNLGWVNDWRKFTEKGGKKKINFFLTYFAPSYSSPFYYFSSIFSPAGELNEYNYPFKKGIKLLKEYTTAKKGKEKIKLLNEMEIEAEKESIAFPVMYSLFLVGRKKNIYGIRTNNLGYVFFEGVKIKNETQE